MNLKKIIENWEKFRGEEFKCSMCGKPIKDDESVVYIAIFSHIRATIPIWWNIIHEDCWRKIKKVWKKE